MLHWLRKPDIPFSREDANRYLPWVIAVMVTLVALLLAAGISLHQASRQSGSLNIQSFQVYVPHAVADEALLDKVTDFLSEVQGVRAIETLEEDRLEQLVAPWTGEQVSLEGLPLPAVLEVTLLDQVPRGEVIASVEAALQAMDARIDVESYQDWVDQLTQFTRMLRLGVFVLVGVLLCALMALVTAVVRTSLRLHFQSVRLLHTIGATDDYIIRQFVSNGCWMVLKGSVMGVGLASLMTVSLSYVSQNLSSPLLPEMSLSLYHALMLVGLPVLLVLLSAIIVRLTIMQMLEQIN